MRRDGPGGVTLSASAAGLVAVAVFAGHGSSGGTLFWLGAAALVVAGIGWLVAPPWLTRAGVVFFVLLAALVVWQAVSIHWSITPAGSWDYANRGLVYLAFAGAGALLGGVPRARVAGGLAALLGALFVVALSAKVVPAFYGDYGRVARLRFPLEYWNELALLGAAAVPLALWIAGRPQLRARIAGALLLYLAAVTVVLTFSRFGIVLAVLAALAWLVVERDRLDSLPALVVAVPAAAIAAGVGFALPGITKDAQPHSVRVHDGIVFGLVLLACVLLVAAAVRVLSGQLGDVVRRRRIALGGVGAVALVCVAVVVVLAVRAGGPIAFVQDRWHEFSATQSVSTASRLGSASSGNRWSWWQQEWHAFTRHPGGGTGAGSFALTSTVAAHNALLSTVEPHNTPLQFLGETGIVGFLLYAGMIAAVAVVVVRSPRDRATIALALVALVGVVHAVADIDWDFVATQGPLFAVVGVLVSRPGEARRLAMLPAAATAACCLAAFYSLFAPWYSARRANAAVAEFEFNKASALADAKTAHSLNPLALPPLYLLGSLEGNRGFVVDATKREPTNPDTWYELAVYDNASKRWWPAWVEINHAYAIDPYSPATISLLQKVRCKPGVEPTSRLCRPRARGASP
jgi:hypothetical protein